MSLLQGCCNKTLRLVATAFLIANILETTPAGEPNFLHKLWKLKDLQNNHNKKLKILDVVFMQRKVVFVISETAVIATSVGNFFLEKSMSILLNASEYQKIYVEVSVNCD